MFWDPLLMLQARDCYLMMSKLDSSPLDFPPPPPQYKCMWPVGLMPMCRAEQPVGKLGLLFPLFMLLAYQHRRGNMYLFLYPSGKPGFWVLEVWAFLITTNKVTVFGLCFRPNREAVRLGWVPLRFGGPVPIWWLKGVSVRRASREAWPLGFVGTS